MNRPLLNAHPTMVCDECGSTYFPGSSQMSSLCPECAHLLYGYPPCDHVFTHGRCQTCGWDGSRSEYIDSLRQRTQQRG